MDEKILDEYLAELGLCIRQLRLSRKLSQEALADECQLDRSYVGGVERGERNLGIKNLLRISHALQVNPAELLAEIPFADHENKGP